MTATLFQLEDPRHQSPSPRYKPKKTLHIGGLALIFNCIRYLADGVEAMSFAGSAGLDNHKINRIIGVPHPQELLYAIHGGRDLPASSSRFTIKARKR